MQKYYCTLIFCDFKAELNQDECTQPLQLAFGSECPSCATVFRWFKEFCKGDNSLQEECRGRLLWAVISNNVVTIPKMLLDDNHCTY